MPLFETIGFNVILSGVAHTVHLCYLIYEKQRLIKRYVCWPRAAILLIKHALTSRSGSLPEGTYSICCLIAGQGSTVGKLCAELRS